MRSGSCEGLDPATIDELAKRLADDATLRVPASLSGQAQEQVPDHSRRVEYLTALLQRDPGVFLERHGEHLGAEDLQAFDGLRDDYEVHFFLRQLEQQREAPQPRPDPRVRNRRLAQLNRLIEAGEYFSEDAMRHRQPLLHHQYVGQYQPAAAPSVPPRPSEGRSHPLSDSILTDLDEAATQERFDTAQAAQDAIEEESSDEDSYPEDRRAEVDQNPPRPAAAAAKGSAEETFTRIATGEAQPPATRPALQPAAEPSARAAAEAGTPAGAAADTGEGAAAGSEHDQQGAQADAENRPDAAPHVHIPEDERRQLAADFLELMHQRFLAGDDEGFVDYKKVDSDEVLDEDWAAEEQQDAEDAYFEQA